jgi:hypothetical protein
MAAEKPYMIFVCDPHRLLGEVAEGERLDRERLRGGGDFWELHGPISATSGDKAIEKLWEACPEMKVNTELRYFPIANFKPKRQRRSFIEKWSLDDAELPDEDPPGQTELAT